ncbi:MAG: hypothetical protein H7281_16165 [Bacteriovorax sp.]|nr:hypothetical protein [Bacteriovorax sp.]
MKITIATIMILMAFATNSFGADKKKMKMMSMTPEQRQSMATVHEKMAACLRSDKAIEDCHKDMMQSCKDMMGADGCPMMDHKGKMHDMDKGMMDKEKEEPEKKKY